jgi:hypothetical protein
MVDFPKQLLLARTPGAHRNALAAPRRTGMTFFDSGMRFFHFALSDAHARLIALRASASA